MKKIVVFFLLMFCLIMCLSAQTSRDTVVFVYSKSDTIMLNKSNSDITVWTYVSNNGDGGFARSVVPKVESDGNLQVCVKNEFFRIEV